MISYLILPFVLLDYLLRFLFLSSLQIFKYEFEDSRQNFHLIARLCSKGNFEEHLPMNLNMIIDKQFKSPSQDINKEKLKMHIQIIYGNRMRTTTLR